jgi:serine/threonine-protein kinase RsbW
MVNRPLGETDPSVTRHTLPAIPTTVPMIRHELDRVLESLGIASERAADIRLALTEACTNVVKHAYPDGSQPGEMVITFEASAQALIVSVADTGRGIDGPSRQPGLGVGLPLIEVLADVVTTAHLRPGTSVRMTFRR